MTIKEVRAVYFSPTGTTRRVVECVAAELAARMSVPMQTVDFTLPQNRQAPLIFDSQSLIVFGTPVIAGRVPNVLLKYLAALEGQGAPAVPIVVFGNRDFDDALIELRDILAEGGCRPFAAAAFVGEHSFSRTLAAGRPDEEDRPSPAVSRTTRPAASTGIPIPSSLPYPVRPSLTAAIISPGTGRGISSIF